MKTSFAVVILLAGAANSYAQGTVLLSDYKDIQLLNVQTAAPADTTPYTSTYGGYTSGTEYYGNGPNINLGVRGSAQWNDSSALGTGSAWAPIRFPNPAR